MQSLEASKNYKNSFSCAAKIFKEEGVFTLWSGAVPRLARLIMSGGIVFTMFVNLTKSFRSREADLHLTGMKKRLICWTPWILKGNTYEGVSTPRHDVGWHTRQTRMISAAVWMTAPT